MKKLIALGTLSVFAIGCGLVVTNGSNEGGAYHERTSLFVTPTTANLALQERMERLEGWDEEDRNRAYQDLYANGINRAELGWIDHGPDNVGGRTRAIVIDNQDVNQHHIWAGSVSGGLFESFDRGGTWTKVEGFPDDKGFGISSMCQTANGTLHIATGHQAESVGGFESSGLNGNGVFVLESDGSFTEVSGTSTYNYINEIACDTINNFVYIASSQGLKKYTHSTATLVNVDGGITSGACRSLSVSKNGQVIICGINSPMRTNVSNDGGATFKDVTTTGGSTSSPIGFGASRIEYAISHEFNSSGKYSIYASCANSFLVGVWHSEDNGNNWTEIAPANDGSPGSFAPFSSGGSGQGTYDNIITVVKGNPNKCILGGIDTYSWSTSGNWTQLSQWFLSEVHPRYVHADNHEMVWDTKGRLYIGNDGGICFSENADTDPEPTFTAANRGYNVTQFYHMSFSGHGDVIGGAQDNGTQANYHDNSTWREHDEVSGGDGFGTEMSFINRNILFASVYYSALRRSNDRGNNTTAFIPSQMEAENSCTAGSTGGDGCGTFNTRVALWEDPDDENSQDSIDYIPSQGYSAGDTVEVPSETSQMTIYYETPTDVVYDDTVDYDPAETTFDTIMVSAVPSTSFNSNLVNYTIVFDQGSVGIDPGDSAYLIDIDTTIFVLDTQLIDHYWGTNPLRPGKIVDMVYDQQIYGVAWDTLRVQDRFQSWFALKNGNGEVYMTRNALRFSSDGGWIKAIDNAAIGSITTMEFSHSGDYLWIGTANGTIWRLTGFNDVYSPGPVYPEPLATRDSLIDWDKGHQATTLAGPFTTASGNPIYGIAVGGDGDGSDDDHIVIAHGGSGAISESINATGAAPTFSNITPGGATSPNGPWYACVIDREDPNLILIGGELGVYQSTNGGTSWEPSNGGFGVTPVYDMGQNWRQYNEGCYKPGTIYIGTFGRGIWSTDEYLSMPHNQDQLDKTKFIPNINIYPNPLNSNGTISFDLESNSDVTVHIFSLSGQLVETIKESGMSAGKNTITFNAAGLPNGTYIVRMTMGERVETSKFIKY